MRFGTVACNHVGMPEGHGAAIQTVAENTGHVIIFRSVGQSATRLLAEGYAAKGFRIDTKSCDWGPMRGFVCVDPRLSKADNRMKRAANQEYTTDALAGAIRLDAIGGLPPATVAAHALLPDWQAGCKPIMISAERVQENAGLGIVGVADRMGILRGVSQDGTGTARLPWALIPAGICMMEPAYARACGTPPPGGYGLFVDHRAAGPAFVQFRPGGVNPIRVMGYDAVLGLTNPDSDEYGYRACVTGDYDLFAVWPPKSYLDPLHNRRPGWDRRPVTENLFRGRAEAARYQHYKLGNITPRITMFKVLLNTALIGQGAYPGGNLVHHSDEVGNVSTLAKPLRECLPLIAFVTNAIQRSARLTDPIIALETEADFSTFTKFCVEERIDPDLKPEWRHYAFW